MQIPPQEFLDQWKKVVSAKYTDQEQFWNFCIQEMWHMGRLMHQRQLVPFNEHETEQDRPLPVMAGHKQALKQHGEKCCYIVDMWTATSIWVPVHWKQQLELQSLAEYRWYLQPKLDKWMQDWLANEQPAPDILGCFVSRWLCCCLPGNITSSVISRSLGRSKWFMGSQSLREPSRICSSPCTEP